MRAGPAGGVVASAIVGVALLVARTLAAKIERNPDPFPLERLAGVFHPPFLAGNLAGQHQLCQRRAGVSGR